MRTFWVELHFRKPWGREFIMGVRYDRCMRVVRMAGGKYLVRTWRQPTKSMMIDPDDMILREIKPRYEKKKGHGQYKYFYEPWIDTIKRETAKHSTFWALYDLFKDAGDTPKAAFKEAWGMCRQSREWKKLLRDARDPDKMNTKEFTERLRRRSRLFEKRRPT